MTTMSAANALASQPVCLPACLLSAASRKQTVKIEPALKL